MAAYAGRGKAKVTVMNRVHGETEASQGVNSAFQSWSFSSKAFLARNRSRSAESSPIFEHTPANKDVPECPGVGGQRTLLSWPGGIRPAELLSPCGTVASPVVSDPPHTRGVLHQKRPCEALDYPWPLPQWLPCHPGERLVLGIPPIEVLRVQAVLKVHLGYVRRREVAPFVFQNNREGGVYRTLTKLSRVKG